MNRVSGLCLLVCLALLGVSAGCGDESSSTSSSSSTQPSKSADAGKLSVGFSQIGAESAWRIANTDSIKNEAAKRGIDLKFTDAQQKQENQIRSLRSFISQNVKVIAFSPVVTTGWEPVLREIKEAGIPVILTDRAVEVTDDSLYTCFIGADFIEEGRRAGKAMVDVTGGKAVIVELQGTPGAAPAIDRKKGFDEIISKNAGMKVIKSQTGDFQRAKGREVMEAFLKSPEASQINALYAHNDDMALGAIQAIEAAGKKPGVDIKIVSVDAIKDAFQAMVDGKLNCTVECNPLLGPQLFDLVEKLAKGESIPKRVVVEEGVFPQEKAKELLPTRQY